MKRAAYIELLDNSGRAKTLIYVFSIVVGLILISLIPTYFEWKTLASLDPSSIRSEDSISDNLLLVQTYLGLAQVGFYIISIVVFIQWFRRAYGNLYRAGLGPLSYGESMALWSWFIPIANLFIPAFIMNEIWMRTKQGIAALDQSFVAPKGKLLISLWWALFVLSTILGRYIFSAVFETLTISEAIQDLKLVLFSELINVVEAILVIMIVSRVSKMETKLAAEIENARGLVHNQ